MQRAGAAARRAGVMGAAAGLTPKFFPFRGTPRGGFRRKDRGFRPAAALSTLTHVLVHGYDFFPEEISCLLSDAVEILRQTDRVFVFGVSPVSMPAPAPRKRRHYDVLWEGKGGDLPDVYIGSQAFLMKTLDCVFVKARDPSRRKPLTGAEAALWERLKSVITKITAQSEAWTKDAVDLDDVDTDIALAKALTGVQPWRIGVSSSSIGTFKLTWRPLESVVIREYEPAKAGLPVPVPLLSVPSRLAVSLGDRPAVSAMLSHIASYGEALRNKRIHQLLEAGVPTLVHGLATDGSPVASPALSAAETPLQGSLLVETLPGLGRGDNEPRRGKRKGGEGRKRARGDKESGADKVQR